MDEDDEFDPASIEKPSMRWWEWPLVIPVFMVVLLFNLYAAVDDCLRKDGV